MNDELEQIRQRAEQDLAAACDSQALAAWYAQYLGRKGEVTSLTRRLGALPPEERPAFGQAVNALKTTLQGSFDRRQEEVRRAELTQRLEAEAVDITLPGRAPDIGTLHPVTQMIREVTDIFAHLGFQTVEGPEVEDAYYAFDALNIPKEHPARDVWDTIFIHSESREIVLRPHTSPMQIRTMEQSTPPVRVVVPGRCYRYEALDATHEWHFHQIEGLAVDERITMSDLKGVLAEFARQIFGRERKVRFRCDYFPFVEPGVDFAIDCMVCKGVGCRVCKGTGWIEILGAGMVHPNLLINVGYDPSRYTGFAFGMGVERLVMLKYGVQDIRAFYQGDVRFLAQFNRAAA
ncbi:phenylalanine--tRNA ligase subunit alpha [Sphaerobacter thermophilus]|uniref:Phenylalanine--tRNA ligase alpha subunit n=1 Tax=Sphaerobacter thermophilus (strain ATCC 49802 / DSM 20745 / KCCM 41009 / NCIMB 13125 / S 6022) TaxID=479434 RepID=D1C4D6_SPHTD|nr:phenylalanine--tRNA ligase subunit alpha [Sphaerobacter thermophilus]ACZ39103.1 phenylalanyl-tRNA synthetase, alpha subunit [Sphaerobacter thermophilus DSM 20745]